LIRNGCAKLNPIRAMRGRIMYSSGRISALLVTRKRVKRDFDSAGRH
jgi:hypothetical protein